MLERAADLIRRRPGLAALAAFACASVYAVQGVGFNQNAHYALVRALSQGTPHVDRYRDTTEDLALYRGHYYAAKAPGLAFVDLPVYEVLRAARLAHPASTGSTPSRTDIAVVWMLGIWSALIPALGLLVLVARVGDDLEPGYGVVAAATLGLATLLLPFSELLFDHSLSAFLGFASFAVLWWRGPPLLAGVVGGLAICVEYPLAIVAALLCVYAGRRALAYAAGAAVGLVPLALYNWWAYGSPTHVAYRDALNGNERGFFGIGAPSARAAAELLFSNIGLLVITPVVALAVYGLVLLWRGGRRREAALFCAIALAFLVYNAGYDPTFGGGSPGPRFLIPILPFLAVATAPAWRARPLVTACLAAASAVSIALLTSTGAVQASDGDWTHRFLHGEFIRTLGSYAGLPRAVAIVPWFALLAVAAWLALRDVPLRPEPLAALVLAAWLAVALGGPRIFTTGELGNQHPGLTPGVIAALAALVAMLRLRPRSAL
jgi:hypothetical protein